MANAFLEHPILNSPYAWPQQHWELGEQGQPTQRVLANRRPVRFITPIPQPRKRKGAVSQSGFVMDDGSRLSTAEQQYELTASIEAIRGHVAR